MNNEGSRIQRQEHWKGFAHPFRPTYAGANMGHPDWLRLELKVFIPL